MRPRGAEAPGPTTALPLILLLATACGYTVGNRIDQQGLHTVAIEVAGNETYRQRLEIPLTSELQRALPVHTGLVPSGRDSADALLQVTIEQVRGLSLVQGTTDPVREGGLVFEVRAVLRDRRSGAVIVDRKILDQSEFRSPVGEDERSAVGEATRDLARKIALALEPEF